MHQLQQRTDDIQSRSGQENQDDKNHQYRHYSLVPFILYIREITKFLILNIDNGYIDTFIVQKY